jgi:tetratricopeptide (TPR) repeat protein
VRFVLATAPHDQATLDALAAACSMNDAHRRAAKVYALAVAACPHDAHARYNLAASLMFNGDLAGAAREIDASIRLQPEFWDAYTVRAQVRRQTADHSAVAELTALLAHHAGDAQAVERLNMALGKAYEDLGDYARASAHFSEGNHVGKLRRRYDFARDARIFDALRAHAPVGAPAGAGCASDEPIFVFGMPRSGTTLMDRILSSHPDVTSAGELKQFGVLLKYACGSPTEAILDPDTLARAQYVADTRPSPARRRVSSTSSRTTSCTRCLLPTRCPTPGSSACGAIRSIPASATFARYFPKARRSTATPATCWTPAATGSGSTS